MRPAFPLSTHERDRALRRLSVLSWGLGIGAVAAAAGMSAAAAHAFKGHSSTDARPVAHRAPVATPAPTPTPRAARGTHVPPAQDVPAIAGQQAPLTPPAQTPVPVPADPVPQAPPPVSGGS